MRLPLLGVSETTRRRIGTVFGATSVLLSAFGIATLAALEGWDTLVDTNVLYFGVLGVGFGVLTFFLVPAQPDNGAVWALAWSGLFSALYTAGLAAGLLLGRRSFPGLTYDQLRELSPSVLPLSAALPLHFWFWAVVPALWLPLTLGLLLFPDGRPPSPRWRWVGWCSFGAISVATAATAYSQNPWSSLPVKASEDSIDGLAGTLNDLGFFLASVGAVLSVASLVARYRHSDGTTRGQIRWIGSGGAVFIVAITAGDQLDAVFGGGLVSDLAGVVVLSALIGCWGVAITRYRLYGIDVVISKSVTYLGLGAVITALFAAVVAGPTVLLGQTQEGKDSNLWLAVIATGLVAVLFEPIRSRMQRWANRLVYGQRSSPHEVLSQMTARLSETGRGGGSDDLARLLADGTGAARAVVWLQTDGTLEPLGSWSADGSMPNEPSAADAGVDDLRVVVPIRHGDEVLGAVSITKSRSDPLTPADRELVADVAAGAGLMLRNIALNRQLEERAIEVRESRQRLIATQDAERHRLERDLHDGAQQQVVALKVKLGIARTIAEREGADEIASLVAGLADETQSAVDALRAVAHGIYPPLLEAEGLGTALQAAARTSATPLTVETGGVGRFERPVEETVYFCVLDAIERARMAGATAVRVVVAGSAGGLVVEIHNDSRLTDGALTAVSDRVDAFGGTITVTPTANESTSITIRLPIDQPALEPA